MNWTQIMGHLGGDAETRVTPNGQKVTSFSVATNSRRGETEETTWWRVTIWWDRLGERYMQKIEPYLKKGSSIIVMGELKKPEIWTGQDGQPRVTLELTAVSVQFSPFGRSSTAAGQPGTQQTQQTSQSGQEYGSVASATQEPSYSGASSTGMAGRTGFTSPIGSAATSNSDLPF